jgi:hypothetical protein
VSVDTGVREPTLLYLDATAGCWWYRNPSAEFLTGLASVVEVHYTTTLENPDSTRVDFAPGFLDFGSTVGRRDTVNLTLGLNAEVHQNSAVRAGFVLPLNRKDDRFFDFEFMLALVRRM